MAAQPRIITPGSEGWKEPAKRIQCHPVSAGAVHAARRMMVNFKIEAIEVPGRNPRTILVTDYNLALFIDICTNLFRIDPFGEKIRHWIQEMKQGRASHEDILKFLREMEIAFIHLPNYKRPYITYRG